MSRLADFTPQMESFEYEFETQNEGGVFSEYEQMELAAELLEVQSEAELEQFLGSLIKKAGSAIGKFVKSPVGKAIGGVLKSAAKVALPMAGTALGGFVGGPLGAKIGGSLASAAGNALGLELEGLSNEDREFEAAKQFVKLAGETVKKTLEQPAANPVNAAKVGIQAAARIHAPGLFGGGAATASGTWRRSGNTIILAAYNPATRPNPTHPRRNHMHDLDRIQMESFEYEFEAEAQNEAEVFGEAEMEALATELMEVQSEAELEQFLGSLIKKAGSAIGSFVKSPVGQALGGVLKSAVKRGLPTVGSALGGMIGGAQGAKIGGQLGSFASGQINEMEMEMETAKDLVRMAANAVKNAAAAPAGDNPVAVAKAAVAQAIKSLPTAAVRGSAQGRWVRRGNRIVLFGV